MSTKAKRAWWSDDRYVYCKDTRKKTHKRTPRGVMGQLIADYMRRTGCTRRQALDALATEQHAHRRARTSDTKMALHTAAVRAAQRDAAEREAIAEHKRRWRERDAETARQDRVRKFFEEC